MRRLQSAHLATVWHAARSRSWGWPLVACLISAASPAARLPMQVSSDQPLPHQPLWRACLHACMHAPFTQQRSGQTTPARNYQASPRKASPVMSIHACITLYAKKLAGGSDTAQESAEVKVYCTCCRSSVNQRPGQDWPQEAHDTDG
jgi:hypothetical protein